MPAWRPMKFKSVEDLQWIEDWEVLLSCNKFMNNDFEKEKDLVAYIIENINEFSNLHLNDLVLEYEVDKPIDKQRFWPRWRRVDIFIKWEKWIYIIECKNASNTTEIRYSIGQLLDYWREYLDSKKELILIANMYDENTAKTIKHYNLPIRYIIISKTNSLEYVREA